MHQELVRLSTSGNAGGGAPRTPEKFSKKFKKSMKSLQFFKILHEIPRFFNSFLNFYQFFGKVLAII